MSLYVELHCYIQQIVECISITFQDLRTYNCFIRDGRLENEIDRLKIVDRSIHTACHFEPDCFILASSPFWGLGSDCSTLFHM
jgi:hypothetical protein